MIISRIVGTATFELNAYNYAEIALYTFNIFYKTTFFFCF